VRVVCVAAGAEDLLVDLGLAGWIVGHSALPAALAEAQPDMVISEDPAGDSPSRRSLGSGVETVEETAGGRQIVRVSVRPRRLDDVVEHILVLAGLLGVAERGAALHKIRSARLLALRMHVARYLVRAGAQQPKTVFVDAGGALRLLGRWVPDMVDAAGGVPLLAGGGDDDRPIAAGEAAAARPDLLLAGVRPPAGAGLAEAAAIATAPDEVRRLVASVGNAWAVDLRRLFDRPGPHLVEGVEMLIRIIMPAALGANGTPPPEDIARPIGQIGRAG
jgi:iron complex transport system substrate-binding protein